MQQMNPALIVGRKNVGLRGPTDNCSKRQLWSLQYTNNRKNWRGPLFVNALCVPVWPGAMPDGGEGLQEWKEI